NQLENDRDAQFWALQAVGWGGLCVVTFLSLTLWYNSSEPRYVAHTVVQALIGAAIAPALRGLYRRIWEAPPLRRSAIIGASVVIAALLWTLLRMFAFDIIVREDDLWSDFGGWFFGSFMVFGGWASLYFGLKYYRMLREERAARRVAISKARSERVRRMSAEAASRDAQLKMLRYQLNPHFLFNSLNSISALIKINRGDDARKMLAELADFLRFALDADPSLETTLGEEADIAKRYLDIEKMRYGDRMKVEFAVAPEAARATVPTMILQPLVENALKHGVAQTDACVSVAVAARRDGDRLIVEITDTGPGFNHLSASGRDGLGLDNVRSRLASYYKKPVELQLLSQTPKGAIVRIDAPFVLLEADPESVYG
ncbi:MAG: sensor histidine kinase, partial [Pseudomonadota bacterium]